MIKATFYLKDNLTFGFSVMGHAGYEDAGKDIVCAGVSALVINTVNCLEEFTADSVVSRTDEDGAVRVKIRGNVSPESDLLLRSLRNGLCKIYEKYGDEYIQVFFKEVN